MILIIKVLLDNNRTIMKSVSKGMILVLASTVFTASGQILYKMGASRLAFDFQLLLTNYALIAGLFSYGIGAFMLIFALKHGELSVLYPIYALNFVWVSILSPVFFQTDSMNTVKWLGVFLIIAGVSTIGRGSSSGVSS